MEYLERQIAAYYMALLVVPIASVFVILIAVVTGVELVLRRATGRPTSFKDLRSIAREVSEYFGGGALVGGIMSTLGLLPGLGIAWLIVRDAGVPMFKLAAPIATLIGSLVILLFFRKALSLNTDRKAHFWWGILGVVLGVSCPVIGIIFWLRYPY